MSSIGRRFAPVLALLAGVVPSCGPVEESIRPDVAVAAADGCTISGTARDDVLRGTSGGDTLCGLGGHDVLIGGGGGDTLVGGRQMLQGAPISK